MAVVSKIRVFPNGKMEAGQFDETGTSGIKLTPDSTVKVTGLDETAEHVRFTPEGVVKAFEFEEK